MSDMKINRDTFFNLCSLLDSFLNDLDYNTLDKHQKRQIDTIKSYILIRDYKGSREDEKIIYTHLLDAKRENNKDSIVKFEEMYLQIKEYSEELKSTLDKKGIVL